MTAGLPATNTFDGTSLLTTEPAATITQSPIVTPGKMMALAPIQQSLPITTGACNGGYNLLSLFFGPLGSAPVIIETPYASVEFSPISILSFAKIKQHLSISEFSCI